MLLLIGALQNQAVACGCDTRTFEAAVAAADEIFLGKLVNVEVIELIRTSNIIEKNNEGVFYEKEISDTTYYDKYFFTVKKKWKGRPRQTEILVEPGTSCDLPIDRVGGWYLVYANSDPLTEYYDEQTGKMVPVPVSSKIGAALKNQHNYLITWLCSRSIDQYSRWIKREDNWFESDQSKLDEVFPNEISLRKYPPAIIGLIAVLLLFITGLSFSDFPEKSLSDS